MILVLAHQNMGKGEILHFCTYNRIKGKNVCRRKNLKWNQREIQSTTPILLFRRHFSTRPPFSPRDPNKAKRCDVVIRSIWYRRNTLSLIMYRNKLAKARKTSKSPGTLVLKKFGPGKLWVEKVWVQNMFIDFLAEIGFLFYPPNKNLKAVAHSFWKICDVVHGRSVTVQRRQTQWKYGCVRTTDTNWLTGVTARDAYASKNNQP